jgi:hypothetical protein
VQPHFVGAGSAASADRHSPVCLRSVILIELRSYLRRLGCGHGSPIAQRSNVWPAAERKDEDPARDEKGRPLGPTLRHNRHLRVGPPRPAGQPMTPSPADHPSGNVPTGVTGHSFGSGGRSGTTRKRTYERSIVAQPSPAPGLGSRGSRTPRRRTTRGPAEGRRGGDRRPFSRTRDHVRWPTTAPMVPAWRHDP